MIQLIKTEYTLLSGRKEYLKLKEDRFEKKIWFGFNQFNQDHMKIEQSKICVASFKAPPLKWCEFRRVIKGK